MVYRPYIISESFSIDKSNSNEICLFYIEERLKDLEKHVESPLNRVRPNIKKSLKGTTL